MRKEGDGGGVLYLVAKGIKECGADYHSDMNSAVFETWVKDKLIPALKQHQKPVVCLDNAPYHSRVFEKFPNTASRVEVIRDFINKHQLPVPEGAKRKSDLLQVVNQAKRQMPTRFVVDEMLAAEGIQVIRYPPYYCIYNPIELIWSQVKRLARAGNVKPELSQSITPLIRNCIAAITPELWRKCSQHARKEEEKDRFLFNRSFLNIDPSLANIMDDSDEED